MGQRDENGCGRRAGCNRQALTEEDDEVGKSLFEELKRRIRSVIPNSATPKHAPAKIVQVTDMPRTRSGKIAEIAVKNSMPGRPRDNMESLENPDGLIHFHKHAKPSD